MAHDFNLTQNDQVNTFVSELINGNEDIEGVSISGSLVQGYADDLSDIDIDIWLSDDTFKKWTEGSVFTTRVPEEVQQETVANYTFIRDNAKFDIALHNISDVLTTSWPIEKRERRQGSWIVYDKNGYARQTLEAQTTFRHPRTFTDKDQYHEPPTDFLPYIISAYLHYMTPREIKRGNYQQANFNLNFVIYQILNYVHLRDECFYPSEKSKWIKGTARMNDKAKQLLDEAALIHAHSADEVARRRKILTEVCTELDMPVYSFQTKDSK